jgi:hypothetical protein
VIKRPGSLSFIYCSSLDARSGRLNNTRDNNADLKIVGKSGKSLIINLDVSSLNLFIKTPLPCLSSCTSSGLLCTSIESLLCLVKSMCLTMVDQDSRSHTLERDNSGCQRRRHACDPRSETSRTSPLALSKTTGTGGIQSLTQSANSLLSPINNESNGWERMVTTSLVLLQHTRRLRPRDTLRRRRCPSCRE